MPGWVHAPLALHVVRGCRSSRPWAPGGGAFRFSAAVSLAAWTAKRDLRRCISGASKYTKSARQVYGSG